MADAGSADIGAHTSYTSAPFTLANPKCVTFRYKLLGGATSNSELRVNLIEPYVGKKTTMWRMSLTQERWQSGRVTLSPTLTTGGKLQFEALYGGNKSSDIYLDDIQMADGTCNMPGKFLELFSLYSSALLLLVFNRVCCL